MASNIFKGLLGRGKAERGELLPEAVFLTPEALAINEARLCHLASLGLDIAGKKVLEVGGGIGLHTCFFESLGCDITFTDGRADNVSEVKRRYPHRTTAVLDLDHEPDLRRLGTFEIIYCYGTLYHLSKPAEALRALARVCTGMILLETCVTPGEEELVRALDEPAFNPNQAVTGVGCRPTRPWVMRQLRENFGFAYHTITQPLHPDFECNWLEPALRKLYRSVFVGSKRALFVPTLSASLRDLQNTVPDNSRGVWLDIGAHLGETTFEHASKHPELKVYACEPNLKLAVERFRVLPNYFVVPVAVSEKDGFSKFHLNANSSASSLLPLNEERLRQWKGGEDLKEQAEVTVPTARLDSLLKWLELPHVDYLKIDT
ncbi:MAG: class I SAM-dependent methyltransferase, partial [Limisphaerales bacterium]